MSSRVAQLPLVKPDWPAPEHVVAFTTTRLGGASAAPFHSFNLGHHVGDSPAHLQANYQLLAQALPHNARPYWLHQVHGAHLVQACDFAEGQALPEADAVVSRSADLACAVLTADCLPVVFCSRQARVVAAAHAGWRGLAAGVLERTVAGMGVAPDDLLVWLGPAIGPLAFEVGPDVRSVFMERAGADAVAVERCFAPSTNRAEHFMADLYGLARERLFRAGVQSIYGGNLCTFSDEERFYSYRRDGVTGRMATLIALTPDN